VEDYYPLESSERKASEWVKGLDRKRRWKGVTGKCALLVIDMQNFFLDPGSHAFIPSSSTVLVKVQQLLKRFPGPVIFTRHENDAGGKNLMSVWWRGVVNGDMSRLHPDIDTRGMPVLRKEHYSAFRGTGLEEMLSGMGIETVAVSGVMTDLCCESTVRDAFMRGFKPILLADCTGTISEEAHLASLKVISRAFGEVLTSEELMLRL